MIVNNSTRLIMADMLANKADSLGTDILLTFWSGPVPTFTQFSDALNNGELHTDNATVGRISTREIITWLESLGGTLLAEYLEFTNNQLFTVTSPTTSILDLSGIDKDIDYVATGTATYFVIINVDDSASQSSYKTSQVNCYQTFIGTVGLGGSGADLEVFDNQITPQTVIKPGLLRINF